MALGGGGCSAVAAAAAEAVEEETKKVRKAYTITKSRESWSEQEHDKFLEALQLFDRDWKKIEAFVGSKTVIQIRSHAQKYFLKVQKNGTSEHVPPPRPKRKAAHPYPQKASKNPAQLPQAATPLPAPCMVEQGYAFTADTTSMIRTSSTTVGVSSRLQSSVQPVSASNLQKGDDTGLNWGALMVNNCCSSSTESPSRTCWSTCETMDQDNYFASIYVKPDFAQVYGFLGSVFDPDTTGHLEKLKEMDPVDVEAVLVLMKNLSINLTSPDFEAHRKLLSTYDGGGTEAGKPGGCNLFQASESVRTLFMVKGE